MWEDNFDGLHSWELGFDKTNSAGMGEKTSRSSILNLHQIFSFLFVEGITMCYRIETQQ